MEGVLGFWEWLAEREWRYSFCKEGSLKRFSVEQLRLRAIKPLLDAKLEI